MKSAVNKLFIITLAILPLTMEISADQIAIEAAEQQIADRGKGRHRSPSRADRHGSHHSHLSHHSSHHRHRHHHHHDKNWERNNWSRNWYYYNTPNNYPYPYFYYYLP